MRGFALKTKRNATIFHIHQIRAALFHAAAMVVEQSAMQFSIVLLQFQRPIKLKASTAAALAMAKNASNLIRSEKIWRKKTL